MTIDSLATQFDSLSLGGLHSDHLAKIASFQEDPKDLACFLLRTSKNIAQRFSEIARKMGEKSFVRLLSRVIQKGTQAHYEAFFTRLGVSFSLTALHISAEKCQGISLLLTRCLPSQGLFLRNYPQMAVADFLKISFPPTLEEFSLSLYNPVTGDELLAYSPEIVNHVFTSCPKIKRFSLFNNPNKVTPEERLTAVNWPASLESVRLPHWRVSHSEIEGLLATASSLQVLEIESFDITVTQKPKFPAQFAKLQIKNPKERRKWAPLLTN